MNTASQLRYRAKIATRPAPTYEEAKRAAFIGAALAFIVEFTYALGPIHELGHVIVGTLTGFTVTGMEWTVTYFAEASSQFGPLVLVAGFATEVVVITAIGLWGARELGWGRIMFALILLPILAIRIWGSTDYGQLIANRGETVARITWWLLLALIALGWNRVATTTTKTEQAAHRAARRRSRQPAGGLR